MPYDHQYFTQYLSDHSSGTHPPLQIQRVESRTLNHLNGVRDTIGSVTLMTHHAFVCLPLSIPISNDESCVVRHPSPVQMAETARHKHHDYYNAPRHPNVPRFTTTSFLPPFACEVPSHCETQARCMTTPHLHQQPVAIPQLEALSQRTVRTTAHVVPQPPPDPRKESR